MRRKALVMVARPVAAALETNQFITSVEPRFEREQLSIVQAGPDNDVERFGMICGDGFEGGAYRIERQLARHDGSHNRFGDDC